MPGTTRVTLRDVARLAQVSKTTASYVLSETPGFQVQDSTRRRVFAAAERLGQANEGAGAIGLGGDHGVACRKQLVLRGKEIAEVGQAGIDAYSGTGGEDEGVGLGDGL